MFQSFKEEIIDKIDKKDEKISQLEEEVNVLNRRLQNLEEKMDDQDAYERRDTLILSGKKIPATTPDENCPELVTKLINENLGVVLKTTEISVAHRLGSPSASQRPDRRRVIVKFCRRDVKTDILSSARRVKAADFYVNESLTPQRQNISFALRRMKTQCPNIISGTSTFDGSVFVWVKPPNPDAPGARDTRHKMNTFSRLQEFCKKAMPKPASYYLSTSND